MGRHLTPEEIALNQQEASCREELEKLETLEAQRESELEREIDESRKLMILYTLAALLKELLTKHRELARIKEAQITSVQKTLRAHGADYG